MSLHTESFEKLGAFYLGRPYNMQTRSGEDSPYLYDSRDLLTHAVCVGMTGSGKTGLCLALLEEAAMDDIPAIIIDPKGDLGNLLLTFPDLAPKDFEPWILPEDAQRKGLSVSEFAAEQARLWREGLAAWGQGPERIRQLRAKAEAVIYTPGSSAGRPVNVLASFAPPATNDPEELAERAQNTAASLLSLMKITADPSQSREGIFLATLLADTWQKGHPLTLETLIERIQRPPFEKVGVLDLETFYPAKDRFALVMALNAVLASPSFAAWRTGEPLDVGRILYTPEGRPRLAVFSIAHLGDEERMFFVSLLLNETLSWTRAQSGTSSLRAILYMDEIFGYLPPSQNPPSKRPMLTLLKQARAFGVGIVLATQNPVDLDYKALSNAGTWFIGRLQTERDKARVLDGLQGAGGGFDRAGMEALLAGLGSRIFLVKNVHEDAPQVIETRWVMSYLRGPLTRDQIRTLTPRSADAASSPPPGVPAAPSSPSPAQVPEAVSAGHRPALPPGLPEVILATAPAFRYEPWLLAVADLDYKDTALKVEFSKTLRRLVPLDDGSAVWEEGETVDSSPALATAPDAGALFADLPAAAAQIKSYPVWEKEFRRWAQQHATVGLKASDHPRLVSRPEESEAEFLARLALVRREARDAAMDALRKKFAPRQAALQTRLERALAGAERQKQQASSARMQTIISMGSSILGAFLGNKKLSAANLGRATTTARSIGRSMKESTEAQQAGQSVEAVQSKIAELDAEFQAESTALAASEPILSEVTIAPKRTGIRNLKVSLAWKPV